MAVRRVSMKNQCYQIIKDKILRSELEMGQTLKIAALSAELETSNTPIREALSMLEVEGLVTVSMNNLAKVVEFSERDFKDMSETTIILLSGGYELCVNQNRCDLLIQAMERALDKQSRAFKSRQYFDFICAAIEFDGSMVTASGNPRLTAVFNNFSSILFLMIGQNHRRAGFHHEENIEEHRALLESVRRQDGSTLPLLKSHFATGLRY